MRLWAEDPNPRLAGGGPLLSRLSENENGMTNCTDVKTLTFLELDRLSIRLGCESDINRRADMELRRRGYTFDAGQQRWIAPSERKE